MAVPSLKTQLAHHLDEKQAVDAISSSHLDIKRAMRATGAGGAGAARVGRAMRE